MKNNKEKVQDATVSSVGTNSNNIENVQKHNKSRTTTTEYIIPDSTTSIIDKSESLRTTDFNNFLKPQVNNSNKLRSECDNVDNIINRIVQWPIQWLIEQSHTDISPPVSGEVQPSAVVNVFPYYDAYVRIMTPLVLLELWQFIYQSACNKEEAR